jgi:chromosome segregation ATPase
MDTKFDSYSNNNGAKIDSILEGIITLMRQIDEIKQQGEKLSNRIDKLEHNQQVILRNTGDSMIMSNNNTNDIEDLKTSCENISDKLDNLDYTIKNLKIYKYYNGE